MRWGPAKRFSLAEGRDLGRFAVLRPSSRSGRTGSAMIGSYAVARRDSKQSAGVVESRRMTRAARKRESFDLRRVTAFHEAGHAVLSAAIANKPEHVSIRPNGNTLGRSGARMSVRPTSRVQVHLAGFVAEHLLTKRRSRQLDQEVGFAIVARLDPALRAAFDDVVERDGYLAVEEVLRMGLFESDDEIRREVERFYEIAKESLSAVWQAVEQVAKALLDHDELDRDAVDEALGDLDIYMPVFAVQQAHGLLPVKAPVAVRGLVDGR